MCAFLPSLDLTKVPFSCAGSYLTLTRPEASAGVRISTVRRAASTPRWQPGTDWSHEVADITLVRDGVEKPATVSAQGEELELRDGFSRIGIVFADAETLVVTASACSVRIRWRRRLTWRLGATPRAYYGFDARSHYYLAFGTDAGSSVEYLYSPANDHDEDPDCLVVTGAGAFQFSLRLTLREDRRFVAPPDYSSVLAARVGEIRSWQELRPAAPAEFERASRVAWYLFWNLQVSPSGGYTRTSILSSKRSMCMMWSWDNYFNAMAVVRADSRLAWNQLLVVLDHQEGNGLLPDCVNDVLGEWGFNKPPVFGLAVRRLLEGTPEHLRKGYAAEVYPGLARFQKWWLRERDLGGDGMIFYMHGNDSGWDNASIFDERCPVASPDLAAYLILGSEALGDLADMLDLPTEAQFWRGQAHQLLSRFSSQFVRGDELIYHVQTAAGREERSGSRSLITRIPILLGHRLPEAVRRRLVEELGNEKRFLSPSGPASEALDSPHYIPNGYWRGPVWGPTTYLIVEGLMAAEEPALAREVAFRFCRTCARTAVFSENYEAISGADQYDSGMTWSAADFVLLARWMAENPP